jgi:hypothetical protein
MTTTSLGRIERRIRTSPGKRLRCHGQPVTSTAVKSQNGTRLTVGSRAEQKPAVVYSRLHGEDAERSVLSKTAPRFWRACWLVPIVSRVRSRAVHLLRYRFG